MNVYHILYHILAAHTQYGASQTHEQLPYAVADVVASTYANALAALKSSLTLQAGSTVAVVSWSETSTGMIVGS